MKKIMLSLAFVLLTCALSQAADFDAYVYWVYPGIRRTIAWDPPIGGADKYEVIVHRMNSGRNIYQGFVTEPKITVLFRTTGLNVVYIRAIKGTEEGEWQNTLNSKVSTVNGQSKAWAILVPTS